MFDYHEPGSLDEALALAARFGADGRFLAGGTDLIIQMRRGRLAPRHVISLHRIPGLDAIAANGEVRLGALVTHRAVERAAAFQDGLRGLVEAARVVGGHQVRNVGTVVGNVVNASPAADVVPVLLTLDARVECLSAAGAREVPLDAFLVGPAQTVRRPDELVTAVRFVPLDGGSATAFVKAGRRRAMEISVACAAVRLTVDGGGERCLAARIALGAVAPTTMRAREAERILEGQPFTPDVLRAAGRAAAADCRPIDDVRASARYRRLLVETLVPRAVRAARERIPGGAS